MQKYESKNACFGGRFLRFVTQKIVTILEIEKRYEVLISALTGEVTNSIGLERCQ